MDKKIEMAEQGNGEKLPASPKKEKKRSSLGVQIAKYATALVVVLVLFWFGFTTVVKEGQTAVILRFGAVRSEVTEPGLYFKLPWPFENTVTYDNRLQYLESNRIEVITADSTNIIIQCYVAYEIADPVLYHNSVGMKEGGASGYIKDQVFNATNLTIGGYQLSALVSLEKEEIKIGQIQEEIFARMKDTCRKSYGIDIRDVSILRLMFPDANLEQVFADMRAARQTQIDQILSEAYKAAQEINDAANVEAENIKAEGTVAAAEISKETKQAVADIHAAAYNNGKELYKFLQELDTLVTSVNGETVLIINVNDPPFNVLTKYADSLTYEGDEVLINDLEQILNRMTEEDRQTVVNGITKLLQQYAVGNGG